jgi:hypothetical protein
MATWKVTYCHYCGQSIRLGVVQMVRIALLTCELQMTGFGDFGVQPV